MLILGKKAAKKFIFCVHLLARIRGLIMTIAAPVVPIQLANNVPIRRRSEFTFGVLLAAQVDKYLVSWVESWHPG